MSDSSTDKAIGKIAIAALVVSSICIPVRADPIGDRTGACCLPDGSCIVVTGTRCQTRGGTYQGDGIACDGADCAVLGACCIPFGICEVATIQVCFGDLGGVIWAPGQNCGTFNCPPLGACCKPDGTCQVAAQSSCEITFGGSYQGDGVECQEARCAPPCPADFDGSGDVGVTDLVSIVEAWGPCAACPEDLDGSGDVGVTDLVALLVAWGDCPSWCGSEARLCTSSRTAADRGRSPCKRLCFDSRRNAGGRRHVRHLP